LQILYGKLVEKNSTELAEAVQREIEENPALERKPEEKDNQEDDDLKKTQDGETFNETSDEIQSNDYYPESNDRPSYLPSANNYSPDDDFTGPVVVAEESIDEYLMNQVREQHLSDRQYLIAEYIIGNIDSNGYLRRTPMLIADDITFNAGQEVETHEVEEVLKVVRKLDPPGIAATDLRDCLLLQLERETPNEVNKLAYHLIKDHFDDFVNNHKDKVSAAMGLTEEQMKQAMAKILTLNPKPGSDFTVSVSDSQNQQISPDFVVDLTYDDDGKPTLTLTLENNIPELQISESYISTYNELKPKYEGKVLDKRKKDDFVYVRDKYQSAAAFIDLLRRRQETLFRTMRSIMMRQKDYFITGDEAKLHPMVLKNVADDTGYDVSVISRVRNNKYVLTPFGTQPLKFFFSEGMKHSSGTDVSSREIQSVLRDIINDEDKKHPYSDDKLCELLKKKGYEIQRRTVAKYRDKLSIPVARLRKQI
jgi:RNA polymerase sigma-54 factor